MTGERDGEQAERVASPHQPRSKCPQLVLGIIQRGTHLGVDLHLAAIELRDDEIAEVRSDRLEEVLPSGDQPARLEVDDEKLLLDAEGRRHVGSGRGMCTWPPGLWRWNGTEG
jgi:hypothetical protein